MNNILQKLRLSLSPAESPAELVFQNDAYWLKRGKRLDGPFCSRCKDKDRELIRLLGYSVTAEYKRCPECNTIIRFRPNAPFGHLRFES